MMKKHLSRRVAVFLVLFGVIAATGIVEAFASAAGSASGNPSSPAATEERVVERSEYTPPEGPVLSSSAIDAIAHREAALANDNSPTSVRAVDTTLKSAEELQPNNVMPPSSNSSMAEMEGSAVVVVVMHGAFVLSNARVPDGHLAPNGRVLTLVLDAHTGQLETRAVTSEEPPDFNALGETQELR